MTRDAFRRELRRRTAGEISDNAVDEAADYCYDQISGYPREEDFRRGTSLAARFDIVLRSQQTGQAFVPQLTPDGLIGSDVMTRLIDPEVRSVRKSFFGSEESPFPTIASMADWIEERNGAQKEATPEDDRRANQIFRELRDKVHECERLLCLLPGTIRRPSFNYRCLPYIRSDDGKLLVANILVRNDPQLAELVEVSEKLAAVTGFTQVSVVIYILVGTRPLLVPVKLTRTQSNERLDERGGPWRNLVLLEFQGPVTFDNFLEIYKEIRRDLNLFNKKGLTETDRRLLETLRSVKGPRRGRDYWERVRVAWDYPKAKQWQSAKVAYHRLKKKLGPDVELLPNIKA